MSGDNENYPQGKIVGDDISGSGVEVSIAKLWQQLTDTAKGLVDKDHDIIVSVTDTDDEAHDIRPEDVETVERDTNEKGGYKITKKDGVKVTVIGATILGVGAGIVAYKKIHPKK